MDPEINKFIPTGGVEYPISRLVRKIIPKWIILMSKLLAIGIIRGTTTIIAENISIIQPIIRRKILRTIRNIKGSLM